MKDNYMKFYAWYSLFDVVDEDGRHINEGWFFLFSQKTWKSGQSALHGLHCDFDGNNKDVTIVILYDYNKMYENGMKLSPLPSEQIEECKFEIFKEIFKLS